VVRGSFRQPAAVTTAGELHALWRTAPVADLDGIIGDGSCLVLAPHPDDESLGCGGLIAACCDAGRAPLVVVLTDGAASHRSAEYPPPRLTSVRESEVRRATEILGLPPDRLRMMHASDGACPCEGPDFTALVDRITQLVRQDHAITAILATWQFDPHCDHEAAALIAAAVARATGIRCVSYPVWGWTIDASQEVPSEPGTIRRFDIAAHRQAKSAAIESHRSQYGGLITDDPNGFELSRDFLRYFSGRFETFLLS
jgi:LmbE family N-acetylglucosaminyl deacetylase